MHIFYFHKYNRLRTYVGQQMNKKKRMVAYRKGNTEQLDAKRRKWSVFVLFSAIFICLVSTGIGGCGWKKTGVEKLMKNASDQINAVVEAYPELAAGKNIEVLQNSCTNAEEHIQAARRLYNAGVTNYNNLCSQFPSSVVAAITGHNMVEYFKTDADKRSDVIF